MRASIPPAIAASSAARRLAAPAQDAPGQELRAFTLDLAEAGVYAQAPVLWKDRPAGHITSGAFIPALGKVVVMALVRRFGEAAGFRAVIMGREIPLNPYMPAHP